MNPISTLTKNLIIPIVTKHSSVDGFTLSDIKWEQFALNFINFEIDAASTYSFFYKLELENLEAVFNELPNAYQNFISQLAEEYVLRNSTNITDTLVADKNEVFLNEVSFYKTVKNVITKNERLRIKKELPILQERLVFELNDKTLENVAKKKSRKDLKQKFKQWDAELAQKEAIKLEPSFDANIMDLNVKPTKSKTKVFQLYYFKYAMAACLVLGFCFWFFNQPKQGASFIKLSESLAEVPAVLTSINVIENKGLGFASKTEKVTLIENQQQNRIISIRKAIESYQKRIEQEDASQKTTTTIAQLKNKIDALQKELSTLEEKEKQYTFVPNVLNVYVSKQNNTYQVIQLDSVFYLIKDKKVYQLQTSKNLLPFNIVKDTVVIDKIDEVLFKNGLPTHYDE